jgi:hypothetical protein
LRIRVNMSATGSVNFIRFASPQPPVLSAYSGEPATAANSQLLNPVILRQRTFRRPSFVVRFASSLNHGLWPTTHGQLPTTNDGSLPGRLRHSRNLSPQRQPAEAQPAHAELAQKRPRPPANLAAIMPARGKFRPRLLFVARLLKYFLDLRVLNSFRCGHAIL